MEDVVDDRPAEKSALEEKALRQLQHIYPLKCAYLGEQTLRELIQHGFKLSMRYGLINDQGMVLMAALTFAVGHGFPRDPQYGWIARRLDNNRWPDPDKRTEELHSKAVLYLKYMLGERGKK